MGLKETLRSDLTEAIRARDELKSGTIRMVLTAITNEEVAGKESRTLSDAEIITVLSREAKKRREAAEAFTIGGRADRAEREEQEGEVIATYLPAQLSEDEIKKLIVEAIAETGASGPAGMGQVMKIVSPKIAGKADGGTVSALVKSALSGGN
ncbi:MAG: GatB/YqeY domain-containing protein [Actinomycetota bacterium]